MSRHGSLVFIISDFQSLTEEAETYLAQLGRFNLVYGVHVFDELERNLPKPGQYSMTDGETFIKVDTSDDQYRADYSDAFALNHGESNLALSDREAPILPTPAMRRRLRCDFMIIAYLARLIESCRCPVPPILLTN